MNKTIVISIFALIALIYFAFDKYLSVDNSVNAHSSNDSSLDFTVIKPPTFTEQKNDLNSKEGISFVNTKENDDISNNQTTVLSQKKADRKMLIDYYNSENKNYDTLENILEKLNSNKTTSIEVKDQVERMKHNLVLSKKMAALVQKLYIDVDGKKEFNRPTLDQIIALQNQLILPVGLLNINPEGNRGD